MLSPRSFSLAAVCALVSLTIFAGEKPIPRNARIFIQKMPNDLDMFIKAEIIKKEVPVQIVGNLDDAEFLMKGVSEGNEKRSWHEGWLTAEKDKFTGAIEIIDREEFLIWAAEAGDRSVWWGHLKRGGARQVANRLVKDLKKSIGNRVSSGSSRVGSSPSAWWKTAETKPKKQPVEAKPDLPEAVTIPSFDAPGSVSPPDEFAGAEALIEKHCRDEWPEDAEARTFCQKRQQRGLRDLRTLRSLDSEEAKLIREQCAAEWPNDFAIRAECEKKGLEKDQNP